MISVVGSEGLGLLSSELVLDSGSAGNVKNQNIGINVTNGNLVLHQQDEQFSTKGTDISFSRTYNSLGLSGNVSGGQFLNSYSQKLFIVSDTELLKVEADGTEVRYVLDEASGRYKASDGEGAFDYFSYNAETEEWTWTDGDSLRSETFKVFNGTPTLNYSLDSFRFGTGDHYNSKL